MTPLDLTSLIFLAAMALVVIVWGSTCTWARGKASGAKIAADKIARLESKVFTLEGRNAALMRDRSRIKGAHPKAQPTTPPTPREEHGMKTSDLSPAMIGQTIRIVRKGIAGTHNYIEGTLEDFDFNVSPIEAYGYWSVRRVFTGLKATVAGLDFNLTGDEELVASPVIHE